MDVLCPRGIETTCRSWRANYRSSGAGGDTWKLQRGTAALKWAVLSDLSRWVSIMELALIHKSKLCSPKYSVQREIMLMSVYWMQAYRQGYLTWVVLYLFSASFNWYLRLRIGEAAKTRSSLCNTFKTSFLCLYFYSHLQLLLPKQFLCAQFPIWTALDLLWVLLYTTA